MLRAGLMAAGEHVQRRQPVNQALIEQEIQRPVYGGRRTGSAIIAQHVKDGVGAERCRAVPDDLQHPPPQIGQARAALLANGFRLSERLLRTGRRRAGKRVRE